MIKHIASSLRHGGTLSPGKITVYASLIMLTCALAVLFFPDAFVNQFLKGRVTKALAETHPECTIRIAGIRYSVWTNRIECINYYNIFPRILAAFASL